MLNEFYQTAGADSGILRGEYEMILEDVRRCDDDGIAQHFLLLGGRGSGKSAFLRQLQVDLAGRFCVVNLAEEQANIYRLFDLLEEIVHELEHQGVEVEWPEMGSDEDLYCRTLFERVYAGLEGTGRRLVLLLDNMDRVLENLGKDSSLLAEYLLEHTGLIVVGASGRMPTTLRIHDMSFHEIFRVIELRPLALKDVRSLLLQWGEQYKMPLLQELVEVRPGLLEAIRLLTDSQIRTWRYFASFVRNGGCDTAYDYLLNLMDRMTPLYRERLNALPPSQRKIVLRLAFCWEAVGAGELGMICRMENKLVSAQLNQLIDKGIVQRVETGQKNLLYRLPDRFFNYWLMVTQGGMREKRRVKELACFLERFYGKDLHEDNRAIDLLPVVKARQGAFEGLEEDIRVVLLDGGEDAEYMLKHLLVHHQVNLVDRFFRSVEFGMQLQERFAALYYCVKGLSANSRWNALKVPTELSPVVEALRGEIVRLQAAYYR